IAANGVLVWQMFYQGYMNSVATNIVKTVLKTAYSDQKFFAGRGESNSNAHEKYQYINRWDGDLYFPLFKGEETVINRLSHKPIGLCRYMGQALVLLSGWVSSDNPLA
ncbi:MAG: hypothetical protein U9M89_00950, partial [Patescibacteria group bacterium]|nr:hypothetical protein [Patescibacteria group bacterium]